MVQSIKINKNQFTVTTTVYEYSSLGNVRAASQRVCELQVCEFASWKFASHIIWKKELPVKDATDTYSSRVKYWHVASLDIIPSKAGHNKVADMCNFLFAYVIS